MDPLHVTRDRFDPIPIFSTESMFIANDYYRSITNIHPSRLHIVMESSLAVAGFEVVIYYFLFPCRVQVACSERAKRSKLELKARRFSLFRNPSTTNNGLNLSTAPSSVSGGCH